MADSRVALGIDQGSSGTKAVLLNQTGETIFRFARPVSTRESSGGRVEQDADELFQSVIEAFHAAQRAAADLGAVVESFGLACQRSGVLAWERKTGEALTPLLTWADTRYENEAKKLQTSAARVFELTTLPLLPNYAALKIADLQRRYSNKDVLVGTLDSYLLSRISAGSSFITDDTMAARTMLYDLRKGDWSEELCAIFGVDHARLAQVSATMSCHGQLHGVGIGAVIADQQAALYSAVQGATPALLNIGSIASFMMPSGDAPYMCRGYLSSIFYTRKNAGTAAKKYLFESVSNACKAVLSYAQSRFRFSTLPEIDQACSTREAGRFETAYFPIRGSGSPLWKNGLPCVFAGNNVSRESRVRALVENIGNFIIYALESISLDVRRTVAPGPILVSGGGSQLDYLLQYIADVSGIQLIRAAEKEATARGAALAAMLSEDQSGRISAGDLDAAGGRLFKRCDSAARARYEDWVKLQSRVLAGELADLEIESENNAGA